MQDETPLNFLVKEMVKDWNEWRRKHPGTIPVLNRADLSKKDLVEADLHGADLIGTNLVGANLSKADLVGADLGGADLIGANLIRANLRRADLGMADLSKIDRGMADPSKVGHDDIHIYGANFHRANLSKADLVGADLHGADLSEAIFHDAKLCKANLSGANLRETDLSKAKLCEANLSGANFHGAILDEANLDRADLQGAHLVNTCLTGANLTGCRIYGLSAWDLKLEGAIQNDLIITKEGEPEVTVDNLEVAQFVHLLLHNEKIRDVINTIGKKAVLILGRFSEERKPVLDVLREALRRERLLPIMFDFSIPVRRNVTETIKILAGLARFVVADVTDATEVRAELHNIVPGFPSLPVQPILLRGRDEFDSLMAHLKDFPWVLPTFEYESQDHLLDNLGERVIAPAEAYVRALEERRRAIAAELAEPS
jgi:uncharacterized protein YjbI with pentapeptide repeats